MRYTVKFEREVVQRDVCERVIEAASPAEARAKAEAMASEFDDDCPDDAAQEGGDDCCDWGVDSVEAVAEPYSSDDILARFDAHEINDEQAIAELQTRGWTERRAYVILDEHKAG